MNLPIYKTKLYNEYQLLIAIHRVKNGLDGLHPYLKLRKKQLSKKINEQNDALNLH